ncbi:hypothetical protein [Brevibacillus daliensis]|nr:hypothetical protein [Brevibacillus daliensis]
MSLNQEQKEQHQEPQPKLNKEAKMVIGSFVGIVLIGIIFIGWFMFFR